MAIKRIIWTDAEWEKLAAALHVELPSLDLYRSTTLAGLTSPGLVRVMRKTLPKARWRDVDLWKARKALLGAYSRLRDRQAGQIAAKESTPPAAPAPIAPAAPASEPVVQEPVAQESARRGGGKPGTPHVQWSEAEWYALAAELHRQNPFANYLTSETLAGLQLSALKSAQVVFPPERRRNLTTASNCKPYLLRAFKLVRQDVARELADQRAKGEGAAAPVAPPQADAPAEAAPAPVEAAPVDIAPVVLEPAAPVTIDTLVAQLGARLADTFATAFIATFTGKFKEAFQTTIPAVMGMAVPAPEEPPPPIASTPLRIETLAQPVATPPAVVKPIRLPHILVVGPLPTQAAELERCYPQVKFSILKDDASNLKALAAQCDRAIGMTSFMSHSVDGKLKKVAGERYARCTGGVSAIKHLLDVWIAQGIVPPRPQLAA